MTAKTTSLKYTGKQTSSFGIRIQGVKHRFNPSEGQLLVIDSQLADTLLALEPHNWTLVEKLPTSVVKPEPPVGQFIDTPQPAESKSFYKSKKDQD